MNSLAFFILFLLFFPSCANSKNYKDAYIVKQQNQLFIKLVGDRPLNSHNPEDIIANKTYTDSLLIPITTTKDGEIKGEDIPVKKGYYRYKGKIIIKGDQLNIALFYDNYDDKTLDPVSWNGDYKLNKQ
jgi:hypothetical protein